MNSKAEARAAVTRVGCLTSSFPLPRPFIPTCLAEFEYEPEETEPREHKGQTVGNIDHMRIGNRANIHSIPPPVFSRTNRRSRPQARIKKRSFPRMETKPSSFTFIPQGWGHPFYLHPWVGRTEMFMLSSR